MKAGSPFPDITVRPVPVRSDGGSHEGKLILSGQDLVAVFTQVTAEENGEGATGSGGWFLEAGSAPAAFS